MAQTCKDVYIVAATRTPIGKAPRGVFKDTRPDDLLVHAIASAMVCPTLWVASRSTASVRLVLRLCQWLPTPLPWAKPKS
jgi:acetyl-CoA acyltransferase